jgi:hypothetical protein
LTKSRSKKKLEQKKRYERQEQEIEQIEIDIKTMRRNLEYVKHPKPTRSDIRKILRHEEERQRPRHKANSKNIIYMPLPIAQYGQLYHQHPASQSYRPPS